VTRKPFAVHAITKHGIAIATKLVAALPGAELFVSDKLRAGAPASSTRSPRTTATSS